MHCLALFKLTKDGNPKRDYYTLRHWGTARSKDGYAMKVFRLRVYPHEDGPRILSWTQFSPAEDQNRDRCDQISIGISYVASISWTHSICEEWDIRPAFNRPGKFSNSWKPISGQPVIESERQVAYAIAVNVKQGKSPRWHLRSYADVYD
jgi:hypothetical protein